ncbi:sulfotransferase family 2 domain-containing protein [Dokdonia sp.]|uniref:sulfotransferase family 2 domain-containing protein n=1 Tax=Dokdonia sp. TaxID=2024995 RepID=UPI003262D56F
MIISYLIKTIFIHVHRTGGSSMINMLKRALPPEQVDIVAQHGNAQTEDAAIFANFPDYFKFGFVRNPWDRLLSWYSLRNKWNPPVDLETDRKQFEEFLESDMALQGDDSFYYNQLDYFTNVSHDLDQVTIYRYENYNEEVKKIAKKLDITIEEIPQVNETTPKDYRDYYTEKSKALIEKKCARDIAHFGYSF